jgi:hypothetical protein
VEPVRIRSGWVTFAAVVAGVVAVYNILSGIAAITKDDQTEAIKEVLYGVDITAWGWFWLVIGALQLLTAVLIYQRNPTGQMLGIVWVFIAASLSMFMIFVAPLWALVVLGINLLVLYALVAETEEFERGRRCCVRRPGPGRGSGPRWRPGIRGRRIRRASLPCLSVSATANPRHQRTFVPGSGQRSSRHAPQPVVSDPWGCTTTCSATI